LGGNLPEKSKAEKYIKTGIKGFDDLFEKGIPKGLKATTTSSDQRQ
jgi:hypothetical protein